MKSLIGTVLYLLSLNVSASLVSIDWKTAGDNLITRDTDSGLEWLDLAYTMNRSYSDISSKLGSGQEFEGWRYATRNEWKSVYSSFGFDTSLSTYTSYPPSNIFDAMHLSVHYMNNTSMTGDERDISQTGLIADPNSTSNGIWTVSYSYDACISILCTAPGPGVTSYGQYFDNTSIFYFDKAYPPDTVLYGGSYMVRTSVVPVPAAAWLFGSGLTGLIGIARRKK